MKIIDVTRPLSKEAIVFPGDLQPRFKQEDRGQYLMSEICISTHTGTHVDAPVHFLKAGKSIDSVPLNHLIGRCRVLDVSGLGSRIDAKHLEGRINNVNRILLRTSFSGATRFDPDYPSLSADAARLLTGKGFLCLGIDSPSVDSYTNDGSVHRELLGHGCIIIELLDLSVVQEGDYTLVALPLRLAGLDGAPARVVLVKDLEENNGYHH